jgi:Flp pilus assembly protein TadG
MTRRKKTSGGQAIVMVTLALVAMCGIMGLAVDLGWSFFVQKQAQAAADGAALAAVHEVFERKAGVVSTVTCGNSTNTDAWCDNQNPPTSCKTIAAPSNLYNGCLYAKDGDKFDYTAARYDVTVQADVPTGAAFNATTWPKTPTGQQLNINGIAYWVTVRASQTIPQLFSSVLGNTTGTVTAIGTAAIVAISYPGSFIGLNQEGDCLANGTGLLNNTGQLFDCGVDVDLAGSNGQAVCPGSAQIAKLCAPDGIVLASQCNGTALPAGSPALGCGAGNANWAGTTTNNPKVWAATTIQIRGNGAVQDPANFIPTPTNQASLGGDPDPFVGQPQPPIVPQGPPCELTEPSNGGPVLGSDVTLGPFTYYVKRIKNGTTTYGDPITVGQGVKVTFSSSGTCGATAGSGAAFPSYVFYGGLYLNGNGNSSIDFAPGQYVMTGPSQNYFSNNNNTFSLMASGGTITCSTCGANSGGTMFITTDDTYTGSLTKPPALIAAPGDQSTFYQGAISLKDTSVTLTGFEKDSGVAPTLNAYDHILLWQDRRNSTDTSDVNGVVTTPSITAVPPAANHVTNTSPGFYMNDGNGTSKYTGVIHQSRGSWLQLDGGTSAVNNSPLQIFTGAIYSNGGSGNTAVTLLPIAKPVITYKTALIL